jgi:hypothetical protein
MIDDEKKYTVEEVIELCKTAPIMVVARKKTELFLCKIGCDDFDKIESEIRSLRVEHSCANPEPDYGVGRKGYVYQFTKMILERYWCYIKLKVKLSNNKKKTIVVISLHEEDTNYEKVQNQ